jgi:glutathione reductase (NADPH)
MDWDLVVIGGGSGGVRAARIAAAHGAKVALIEGYRLGGTCVIRGCVPKKLMVYASRFAQDFEEAAGYGWTVGQPRLDWSLLKSRRDAEVSRLEALYAGLLQRSSVTVLQATAKVQGPNTVQATLQDGSVRLLTASHILVASGSKATHAQTFPGSELLLDSNGFFELEKLPQRTVILGAGYIGVELACILRGLGCQVTLVLRGASILRGFDREAATMVQQEMVASGIEILEHQSIRAVRSLPGDDLKVELDLEVVRHADCVIQAIGRVPNTEGLGLESAGVSLGADGAVVVDELSRSNVPSIWAVGDVTHRKMLTPAAIREGHAFADHVFGKSSRPVHYGLVPSAVFTTPELGTVGLTEEAALQEFADIDVYCATFRPMKATLSGHSGRVLLKLVVHRSTDRVLGFHAVGPDAGEMAQLVAVALEAGATKSHFDRTLAIHPTAAEELVTMRAPTRRHGVAEVH